MPHPPSQFNFYKKSRLSVAPRPPAFPRLIRDDGRKYFEEQWVWATDPKRSCRVYLPSPCHETDWLNGNTLIEEAVSMFAVVWGAIWLLSRRWWEDSHIEMKWGHFSNCSWAFWLEMDFAWFPQACCRAPQFQNSRKSRIIPVIAGEVLSQKLLVDGSTWSSLLITRD